MKTALMPDLAPHPAETAGAGPGMDAQRAGSISALERLRATERAATGAAHAMWDAAADLLDDGQLECLGADLDAILAVDARAPRFQARLLRKAAVLRASMPALWNLFSKGDISAEQFRDIAVRVQRLDTPALVAVDAHLEWLADTGQFDGCVDAAWLTSQVDSAIFEALPDILEQAEKDRTRTEFVSLQPDLFGGGRLYGELGPENFQTVSSGLDARITRDRLLDRAALLPADGDDAHHLHEAARHNRQTIGAARAAALAGLCRDELSGTTPSAGDGGRAPRVALTITASLDTLAGFDRPAQLLHRLSGGRMWISATEARRLTDQHPTLVRTIVLDETGQALGIGRRHQKPPGWLADTIRALNPTCTMPGCDQSSQTCDIDHAHEWRDGGPTDLDNLAPVCRRHHTAKTNGLLTARQHPDGARTWTDRQTGWTGSTGPPATRTLPSRPHDHPPDPG